MVHEFVKTLVLTASKLGNSVQKNTTSKHWDTVLEYDLVIPDVEKHSNYLTGLTTDILRY